MGRGRIRFVAGLLLAFGIWPACHFFVVQHYRMNPWKFAGWAMYSRHVFKPKLEVFLLDDGRRVELPLTEPELREAAALRDTFRRESREWGLLATPDALVSSIQSVFEPSEGIEVVVQRFSIDPVPARVSVRRESHFYLADGRVVREFSD